TVLQAQSQEIPQCQAVAAPPRDAALRVDSLEVAHQQHPEVRPRRNRRPSLTGCVERCATIFHEAIESRFVQHPIQSLVERVSRRARQRACCHPHRSVSSTAPPQRHHLTSTRATLYITHCAIRTFSTSC